MSVLDVVIPARHAERTLPRTLAALAVQRVDGVKVIVVDDGSLDDTAAIAAHWPSPTVTVVTGEGRGPSAARNLGARHGTAPWVVFVDADDEPSPTWLTELLSVTDRAGAVGGAGVIRRPGRADESVPLGNGSPETHGCRFHFLAGLYAVRRDVFEAIGGFDESLRFGENTELGFRVTEACASRRLALRSTPAVLLTMHRPADDHRRAHGAPERLHSALRMLERHGDRLALSPVHLSSYHAIASVQARRCGDKSLAFTHSTLAVRAHPAQAKHWLRMLQAAAMRDRAVADPQPLVVHVLASDLFRGAQAEARTVCDALTRDGIRHEALTLFAGDTANLRAEHELGIGESWPRAGIDPRAVAALRRWRRTARPQVVVAHGSEALRYALLAFPWRVVTARRIGVADSRAHRFPRRWLYRWLHRRPQQILAVSSSVAADAASFGRADALVIPNCRSVEPYPRRELPPHSPIRLLFAGQLTAGKRPDWFLDAVSATQRAGVDVRWSIAGDGPMREQLASRSVGGGHLLGSCADMAAVLGDHDILVFPSGRAGEGMPGILIEAGMAGCAVVSTDAPGVRDVVDDGVTGTIVGVDAHADLVEAVVSLASRPELIESMGRAGRLRCEQRFDVTTVARQWAAAVEPAHLEPSG